MQKASQQQLMTFKAGTMQARQDRHSDGGSRLTTKVHYLTNCELILDVWEERLVRLHPAAVCESERDSALQHGIAMQPNVATTHYALSIQMW
jgi:hypothetical protein